MMIYRKIMYGVIEGGTYEKIKVINSGQLTKRNKVELFKHHVFDEDEVQRKFKCGKYPYKKKKGLGRKQLIFISTQEKIKRVTFYLKKQDSDRLYPLQPQKDWFHQKDLTNNYINTLRVLTLVCIDQDEADKLYK